MEAPERSPSSSTRPHPRLVMAGRRMLVEVGPMRLTHEAAEQLVGELQEHLDRVSVGRARSGWSSVRGWLDGHFAGAPTARVRLDGGTVKAVPIRRERAGLVLARVGLFRVAFLVKNSRRWSGFVSAYRPGVLGSPLASATSRRVSTTLDEVERVAPWRAP